MSDKSILVSIHMITYMHAKFIEQAIKSILMQEVDFEVELIIADDNSPDNTEKVVIEVQKNHPNGHWIKYTKHKKNKGMMPNFIWALNQCKGKYIALCEGDDYWTDPYKLQKQVDFLEANESVIGTFHVCDTIKNQEVIKTSEPHPTPIDNIESLFENWKKIHTLSLVFRNAPIMNEVVYFKNVRAVDLLMCTLLLHHGSLVGLSDNMGVYRKHEGGISLELKLGRELLFKSSNVLFLQELLTDNRFKKDWSFIKTYNTALMQEIDQELIKMNKTINDTPTTFLGFLKQKLIKK